jgi:hypothetical protein
MRKLPLLISKLALAMPFAILLLPRPLVADEILTLAPEQLVGLLDKGQKVRLVLKSGTHAEARVEDVKFPDLQVEVRRTDNPRDLPKGKHVVSLDRLATVSTRRCSGNKRKALPILLSGLLAPSLLTVKLKERWAFPAAIGTIAAAAVIGYYGGKASDCPPVTINVRHGCSGESVAECSGFRATGVGMEPRKPAALHPLKSVSWR